MRIGIITLTGTSNYGADLQIHALQKVLEQQGQDCTTITYDNPTVLMDHNPKYMIRKPGVKQKLKALLFSRAYGQRYAKFKEFEKKYCRFSPDAYTKDNIAQANQKYDCFIAGSDQIWNYDITGKDENYFLTFADQSKKLCAYAASSGTEGLSPAAEAANLSQFSRFQVISVREKRLQDYLSEKLPADSAAKLCTDLDPTLLLDKKYWMQFVKKSSPHPRPYILMYLIRQTPEFKALLEHLQKEYQCDIICITKRKMHRNGWKDVYLIGPDEFLNYLYHARFIVTGSFHAVCFSIQFEKDFFITGSPIVERNERLTAITDALGIQNRFIGKEMQDEQPIDYASVKEKLHVLREQSMQTIYRICEATEGETL